jgi:hypothetical protein
MNNNRVLLSVGIPKIAFMKIAVDAYDFRYLVTIFKRLFPYYKTYVPFWLIDLPTLFLPNTLVRGLHRARNCTQGTCRRQAGIQ